MTNASFFSSLIYERLIGKVHQLSPKDRVQTSCHNMDDSRSFTLDPGCQALHVQEEVT